MFYLYHHHDLDRLAELLAELIRRRERRSALEPDTVIVPNRGVGRWLQMQLAESEGVAANLELPLLARFIWQVVPAALPGRPESPEFERHRMRWHLYGLLPQIAERSEAVARYLEGEPREVQRLQLADRLADVFDQYLIYRPAMLGAWEADQIDDADPDRWQAPVWQALVERLGRDHRARLLRRFVEDAAGGKIDTEALPGAVYCFGLGQIPPEYVKFLYALGQCIDVHFLLPNPCEGYWGDIQKRRVELDAPPDEKLPEEEVALEQGHPLLASLGRGTRDLLRVLYSDELSAIHEPELGAALAYEPPAGDSLLARVQAGIIGMQAPLEDRGMADGDVSVQVHACHGPLREVQVLHDQLLDLLARDPELTPRDIVVMMPDVGAYAPAIRGVFGAAEGRRRLPFSISDRAREAGHPIVQSFQRLIGLPLSRWTASEVLALAAVPAIARRFGLDESSLAVVRDWTQSAGVRWGLDATTRERFGAGAFEQNTWRFGLDRLLLGVAQSDEETLTAGVAPWSGLEGGETAALGSFWLLLERLRAWHDSLWEPAAAGAWQERLNAMIDDLFRSDDDRDENSAIDELRQAIAVLGDAADCLEDEALPWEAVRETLLGELSLPAGRQPFLSGGITFCGLMPLRAVPFKVVCLLGMDDSAFPRQETHRGFNVLRARPRLGDHNIRDDDRLLFLQALTAAREIFYISYTGQDVAGGETLPPSPLVGEWLDFLHRHYFHGRPRAAFEDRLIARQPMHPFDERLFRAAPAHPRLFTFAREWQPASRAGDTERIDAPAFADGGKAGPPPTEAAGHIVELGDLRRFFDHPAQAFLRGELQIDLEALDEEIDDDEPLALYGLEAWQLRNDLFERARRDGRDHVSEQPDPLHRARGTLPPPPLDAGPFADQAEQVNALLPIQRAWTGDGEPDRLDIDLTIGGRRLAGRIGNVWPDGPRLLRPGSLGMKYRLRSWIDYLVYRASGREGSLRLAGLERGEAAEYAAHIDEDAAREHLARLLDIYEAGQREPLLFLPSLAETYLDYVANGKTHVYALNKANGQVTALPGRGRDYDADSLYFRLLLTDNDTPLGADPVESYFCRLAEAICGPPHERIRAAGEETA